MTYCSVEEIRKFQTCFECKQADKKGKQTKQAQIRKKNLEGGGKFAKKSRGQYWNNVVADRIQFQEQSFPINLVKILLG